MKLDVIKESFVGLGYPVLDDYHVARNECHVPPYMVLSIGSFALEPYTMGGPQEVWEMSAIVHLPIDTAHQDVVEVAETLTGIICHLPHYRYCSLKISWPAVDRGYWIEPDDFVPPDFRLEAEFQLVVPTSR